MKDIVVGKVYCLMARCVENGVVYEELISIFNSKENFEEGDMTLEESVAFMNKLNSEMKQKGRPGKVQEYFYREMDLLK